MKDSDEISRVKSPLPLWKLVLLTLPWFGVQFAWSAEFSTQSPYMRALGLSTSLTTLTWSAGPVSGLISQPIVGALSDRCRSRFGRRRPFIVVGAIVTVLAQTMYAWSTELGEAMGDSGCARGAALALSITAFWIMDASINIIQTPLRAIVADIAHVDQQELGQSLASLWNALGAIAGFLFASRVDVVDAIRPYFGTSSALLLITSGVACAVVSEVPLSRGGGEDKGTRATGDPFAAAEEEEEKTTTCGAVAAAFRDMGRGIRQMPPAMRKLCVLQFLTWGAWFTYNPNWSLWLGSYIFDGTAPTPAGCGVAGNATAAADAAADAAVARFNDGTHAGAIGSAAQAGVQLVFSFLIPPLVRCLGLRPTYAASFLVMVAAFLGMGLLPTLASWSAAKPGAIALMAATGIPLAATNVFPFALIGRLFAADRSLALYMGALNIFIALPQMLDTLYTGHLASGAGWSYVLLSGAVWSVAALLAIFIVDTEPPGDGSTALLDVSESHKQSGYDDKGEYLTL